MANDKQRAKSVIFELVRQSHCTSITGKVRLFKAFYFAHLYYAKGDENGYLSEWPIVKMPRGPGIDSFDVLMSELESEGSLLTEDVNVGPFPAVKYTAKTQPSDYCLDDPMVEAIKDSINFIDNKSGVELSEHTHDFSISWNEETIGSELNIYKDLYRPTEERKAISKEVDRIIEELFD